jgi:hypothetical protein
MSACDDDAGSPGACSAGLGEVNFTGDAGAGRDGGNFILWIRE